MEDSDDDGIYGPEDAFDPEVHSTILHDLSQPLHPQSVRHSPQGAVLFRRLGINVTRWLLSYLAIEDMIRFTSACRHLYRFGNDPEVLSNYGRLQDESIGDPQWTLRRAFIEKHRVKELETGKDCELKRTVIFDPKFVTVVHVETVDSVLVFFSVFESRLLVWKYVAERCITLLSQASPPEVIACDVHEDCILLLGACVLVAVWRPWRTMLAENIESLTFTFQTHVHNGYLKLVRSHKMVAVQRGCHLSLFSDKLQLLHSFDLTARGGFLSFCTSLFVPYRTQPYVVSVICSDCYQIDVTRPMEIRKKTYPFRFIIQVDCLAIESEGRERSFLICLGQKLQTTDLYANGKLLLENTQQFRFLDDKLICLYDGRVIALFSASLQGITRLRQFLATDAAPARLFPTYSLFMCLETSRNYSYSHSAYIPTTTVTYVTYNGLKVHTAKLPAFASRCLFAFRSVVVLQGDSWPSNAPCVILLHYFLDAGKPQLSIEELLTSYSSSRPSFGLPLTWKQRQEQFVQRRVARKEEERAKKAKIALRYSLRWKNKIRKCRQVFLRLLLVGDI